MRGDLIVLRRVDAAESALHIGAALALGGIVASSVALAAVGAAIVLAASVWAGLETARDEVVTRWDTPPTHATRYQDRHGVDGRHAPARVNRRVAR